LTAYQAVVLLLWTFLEELCVRYTFYLSEIIVAQTHHSAL
jgi:hypothetical protein